MASQDVIRAADAPLPDASPAPSQGVAPRAMRVQAATVELKVSLIDDGERLRAVDPVAVDDLAVSIREGTLAHPITVRPVAGRFALVVGAHRLAAFRQLGRVAIPAVIRQMSDLEARQLEIDENLVRQNLNPLERVVFVAERLQVWAERNPDKLQADASLPVKRRGRPPTNFGKLPKIDGYVPLMMGFTADTARETGLSPRTVNRTIQTANGLSPNLRDRLQGSWVAKNDAALRGLAAIADREEQAAAVEVLLDGRTKNVAAARAIVAGATPEMASEKTPSQALAADFRKLWKSASPTQRGEMLTWLSGQALPKGWSITQDTGDAA